MIDSVSQTTEVADPCRKYAESVEDEVESVPLNVLIEATSPTTRIDGQLTVKEKERYRFRICKTCKIEINRPLIPVKMALFFWFMGAPQSVAFLQVYLKQRGLTIVQISLMTAVGSAVAFIGSYISGLLSDKIGTPKPILLGFLVATCVLAVCFIVIPNVRDCEIKTSRLHCNNTTSNNLTASILCEDMKHTLLLGKCEFTYSDVLIIPSDISNCIDIYDNETQTVLNLQSKDKRKVAVDTQNCTYEAQLEEHANITCDVINCEVFQEKCFKQKTCDSWERKTIPLLTAYGVLICLFHFIRSTSYRFFDAIVVTLMKDYNADFGQQRIFSTLGSMIGPAIAGYIIRYLWPWGNGKMYSLSFGFLLIFTLLTVFSLWRVDVHVKESPKRVGGKSVMFFKKPKVLIFMLVVFVSGTAFNFDNNFNSLYLTELHASAFLIGLKKAIDNVYALPFLFTSKWWTRKIGEENLCLISLLAHAVQGFLTSMLKDPWLILIIALCEIFSYHLMSVAMVQHCQKIAPKELSATVIITAGSILFLVGKVSGSLIGGMIMSSYGGRIAYRVIASMCLVTALLYAIFLYCSRSRNNKDVKRLPKL